MNSAPRLKEWLRMGALCPLLALPLTVGDALILSGALLVILLFTHLVIIALRRCIAESQRLIIVALIAAFGAAIIDMLLQTFCYRQAQQLQMYLPLLAIVPLLMLKTNVATFNADAATPARSIVNIVAAGGAFLLTLTGAAAIRSAASTDVATVIGFFTSALLLMLTNKTDAGHDSSGSIDNDQTMTAVTPRTRARVTGPLR